MSIDVVTYLRNLASPDPYDERPTPHAKELYQAADEIETLRKQLRTEKDSHLSTGHTMGAKAQSLFLELAAMTKERDTLRAALKEILDCPTWAVGTLVAEAKYKLLVEDDVEQARRTT